MLVWLGDVPKDALKRHTSYALLEIPRLEGRQVLVSDEVGNAVFVALQSVPKEHLLAMDKAELLERYGDCVQRVVARSDGEWVDEAVKMLFSTLKKSEKIDISLRERVRDELKERFTPGDFFDEEGKRRFDFTGNQGSAALVVGGMRFTALARLFGQDAATAASRSSYAAALFLASVWGAAHPQVEPLLKAESRDKALKSYLGEDKEKWLAFVRGEPVTVKYLGVEHVVRADEPFTDKESYLALKTKERVQREFAGRGMAEFVGMFFPAEERGDSNIFFRSHLCHLIFARILFGSDPTLERLIANEKEGKELQAWLGQDVQKWVAFVKGATVQLASGKQIAAEHPLSTRKDLLTCPETDRRALSYAGLSLNTISHTVFSQQEPILAERRNPLSDGISLLFIAKVLYGSDPELEHSIFQAKLDRSLQGVLGLDLDRWRQYIKGELSLEVDIDGQMVSAHAERPVRDAKEMLSTPVKQLKTLSYAGKGVSALGGLFISKGGESVPIGSARDVERLALAIFGNERVSEQEPCYLAERVLEGDIREKVIEQLGASRSAWKKFIQGNPLVVEVDGKQYSRTCETVFSSLEDCSRLTRSDLPKLTFSGLGLISLATKIGFHGRSMNPNAHMSSFLTLMRAIFAEETLNVDQAETPSRS